MAGMGEPGKRPAIDQPYRIKRLAALLAHERFGNNKSELARFLGYKGPAFVRQMIDGERPITEKTVDEIESKEGGRFTGWFKRPLKLSPMAVKLAKRFDEKVPPELQDSTFSLLTQQLDLLAANVAGRAKEPPAPVPTE